MGGVLRRPVLSCVLSAGLLVALAAAGAGDARQQAEQRVALGAERAGARDARPSASSLPGRGRPGDRRRHRAAAAGAAAQRRSGGSSSSRSHAASHTRRSRSTAADGTAAVVELPLTGAGDDAASKRAVALLRHELVPQTLGRIPGVETAVTGVTAEDVDFTRQMKHGVPYVIVFVLAFAFLLLLVAFRSIVVPLKAIVLNLLSVGAAYGVLVLVFQHTGPSRSSASLERLDHLLAPALPLRRPLRPLDGLPRLHPQPGPRGGRRRHGHDAAVRYGITVTAGVVTSAALVMVGVFSLFGTLSSLEIKQAGVGLAAAVLIDATIIRAVLLPATMKLLGDWNWYLPRALQWLPRASLTRGRRRPRLPSRSNRCADRLWRRRQ